MKTIIFILLMLFISLTSFSQTRLDYQRKSKNQKTTAWVLLIGGTTMITAGAISLSSSDAWSSSNTEGFLILGGLVADLVSIPFFISARRNARKTAALEINNQSASIFKKNSLIVKTQPCITLKIQL
ncbi:hypothetical protein [Solitalea lacus]|uniref:hypothetical protein n=1 Tax=Solitalea lacus TaxID=2911172 RepID=UPI001EDB83B4|nr:hypothetical protein [Solitalea lacus]UKJ07655.1 hypothetical protein L2B55_00475 [Solitalea lacus]